MRFALYRSAPGIGARIGWFTRSVYSHVALWFHEQHECYEAVAAGFVKASSLVENHDKGTCVDILAYKDALLPVEVEQALKSARRLVGAPYDYAMCLGGFPLRMGWEPKKFRNQYFCSEAAAIVAAALGRPIVERTLPWKVSPEDVNKSAVLKWESSIVL